MDLLERYGDTLCSAKDLDLIVKHNVNLSLTKDKIITI